jgi:hypothetical protein
MLALAALGSTSSGKEDTDKDSPATSSSKGYCPGSALTYLGATYNFISQTLANKLDLGATKAGRTKKKTKMPPLIATVNDEPLRATKVIQQTVCRQDSARTEQSHVINFIVTNIVYYNMILGMA